MVRPMSVPGAPNLRLARVNHPSLKWYKSSPVRRPRQRMRSGGSAACSGFHVSVACKAHAPMAVGESKADAHALPKHSKSDAQKNLSPIHPEAHEPKHEADQRRLHERCVGRAGDLEKILP